jgi:GT2 family glycosyltransferase
MPVNSGGGHATGSSLVGVVTVTYNSGAFLAEFVRSCSTQTGAHFMVYCIDNDSQDQTVEMLGAIADERFSTMFNRTNRGVAEANNQGIVEALRAGCEWVLLLNNDTSFGPGFFSTLLADCVRHGWRVIVPKIHYDIPAGHVWYAGGGFTAIKGYTGFHEGIGERDTGQYDGARTVEYSPTCAMLIHRSVFDEVGLMDESYFVYFDDTDFCWRLREHGVTIGYTSSTTLVHKVGGSTGGRNSPFTARITARNRLYFLRKHLGLWAAWLWTPVFLLYYVAQYGLRGNGACLRASFQGAFSYQRMSCREPPLPPGLGSDAKSGI